MSILREKLVREHIENHYPNATMVHYDDADSDLVFYHTKQLQKVDEDWFPLCCYKDRETGERCTAEERRSYIPIRREKQVQAKPRDLSCNRFVRFPA